MGHPCKALRTGSHTESVSYGFRDTAPPAAPVGHGFSAMSVAPGGHAYSSWDPAPPAAPVGTCRPVFSSRQVVYWLCVCVVALCVFGSLCDGVSLFHSTNVTLLHGHIQMWVSVSVCLRVGVFIYITFVVPRLRGLYPAAMAPPVRPLSAMAHCNTCAPCLSA